MDGQVPCPTFCLLGGYFLLHCFSRLHLNGVIVQVLSIFSLHPHSKMINPWIKLEPFPPPLPGHKEFLSVNLETGTSTTVGMKWRSGLPAHGTYLCPLVLSGLIPDVPLLPMMNCCWACPTLRLVEPNRNLHKMVSCSHMISCCLIIRHTIFTRAQWHIWRLDDLSPEL